MLFFKDFPRTPYIFGDQETQGGEQVTYEIYQDISRFSDVIDQIKDNVSFYQKYSIRENDRPDQVSYKLYGTPEYHWTFYLLNDHLRARGWPLTLSQLEDIVKRDFPHYTFTTRNDLTGILLVDQIASGSTSGNRGIILKRNLDLGQVTVASNGPFLKNETIRNVAFNAIPGSVVAASVSPEYLSAHHYEDGDGNWVDVPWQSNPGAQLTEITHYDRYVRKNNELKEIRVVKPELISEVTSAYFQAIKG